MSPAFIKGIKGIKKHPSCEPQDAQEDDGIEVAATPGHEPQIVFDRYHVAAKANDAVDTVRRAESKTRPELKRSRYSWLKNDANLTVKQREQLTWLTRPSMQLKTTRAARWRDDFNGFYEQSTAAAAEAYLQRWCYGAKRSRLEADQGVRADGRGALGWDRRLAAKPAQQRTSRWHQLAHPGREAPGPGLPLQTQDDHDHLPHLRQAPATPNPHDLARSRISPRPEAMSGSSPGWNVIT